MNTFTTHEQVIADVQKENSLPWSLTFPTQAQEKNLVQQAINQLAYNLHLKLNEKSQTSTCFSPLSITAVLGMLLHAMSDQNQALFLKNIRLDSLSAGTVHRAIWEIINDLSLNVNLANALALPSELMIYEAYKDNIAKDYRAEFFFIEKEPNLAADAINAWIKEKTHGHISYLLKPTDLPYEAFVLLNALHFKADWKTPFQERAPAPFTFEKYGIQQVNMMEQTTPIYLLVLDTFTFLEIPYKSQEGHRLTYTIFLPSQGTSLKDLEGRLTPNFIQECRQASLLENCKITMPKIDLDVRIDTLLDTLQEMGLALKGTLSNLGPNAELIKIITQTKVKVDEKGTVASAATAAIGVTKAYIPKEPKQILIDRDFAFFIMDCDTPLFQGNIKDPFVLPAES